MDYCSNDFDLQEALTFWGRELEPDSYLEIGVNNGETLACLLRSHIPKRLVLCDSWTGEWGGAPHGSHLHLLPLLEKLHATHARFLDGSSHDLIHTLKETFDFITVDADHSAEGARQDLLDTWPLLNPTGLLFFHDIYHPAHPYLLNVVKTFAAYVAAKTWRITDPKPGVLGTAILTKEKA